MGCRLSWCQICDLPKNIQWDSLIKNVPQCIEVPKLRDNITADYMSQLSTELFGAFEMHTSLMPNVAEAASHPLSLKQ